MRDLLDALDSGTIAALSALVGALIGGAGVAGIVVAWLRNRPNMVAAKGEQRQDAVEEWRSLFNEVREELDTLRREKDRVLASYYGMLGLWIQFRNHVSSEVSGIGILIDRKEIEAAQQRLEALGRHVAGMRLPTEDPTRASPGDG